MIHCENNLYFENYTIGSKILERFIQLKSKRPINKNEFEIMGNRIAEDGTYRELLRTSPPKIR